MTAPGARDCAGKRKQGVRDGVLLALVMVVAALLRGLYLGELRLDPRIQTPMLDSALTLGWAEAGASGRWDLLPPALDRLRSIPFTPYVRAPGYPNWLSGFFRITGSGRFGALVVQQVLGLWVVALLWLATRRWVSVRTAWFTAVLAAVYWPSLYYGGEFLDTALLTPLVVSAMLLLGGVAEGLVARAGAGVARSGRRRLILLSVGAGIASGTALVVRPSSRVLVPAGLLWLLWIAWRRQNPSLRASVLADISRGMTSGGSVDVDSDVLLASRSPSWRMRVRTILRGLPSAVRLAWPALAALLAGVVLLTFPFTARNLARGGSLLPLAVGDSVAALVAVLPEHEGYHDDDLGLGSRLDRLGDYPQLAEVSGTTSAWGIARHFARQRRALYYHQPESTAFALARRVQLFWGPRDVGSTRVVELDRQASRVLRRLPGWLPVWLSLGVLGVVFRIRSSRRLVFRPESRSTDLVKHSMPLLALGILALWTGSHVPFLASGHWRQPVMPLVFFLGAWAVEDAFRLWSSRNRREAVRWVLALLFLSLALAQNAGGYVPNRAKWLLDRGMALESAGEDDAARVAYRTVLLVTPGIRDPENGVSWGDGGLSERDAGRYRKAAAVACLKLGNQAARQSDPARSLRYFRLAFELDPARSEALVNAGMMLLRAGQSGQAAELLEQAVQRDFRVFPAYYPLAQALYRLGRYEEALLHLESLLSFQPDHTKARSLHRLLSVDP